jgi:hypothetical protein
MATDMHPTRDKLNNIVFWDVVLCRSWVNRRFRGTYRLRRKIREWGTSVSRWLQTEPPVGNNQLYKNSKGGIVSHMGNPTHREERGRVNPRSTQHHIPEDDILHSHYCEYLKPYINKQITMQIKLL